MSYACCKIYSICGGIFFVDRAALLSSSVYAECLDDDVSIENCTYVINETCDYINCALGKLDTTISSSCSVNLIDCTTRKLLLTKGPGLSNDEYIVYICVGTGKLSPSVVYPWIPLCGDQWGSNEATVVCREQGLDIEGGVIITWLMYVSII